MVPPSLVQSANFDSGAGGSASLAALFTGAQTAGNANFVFIYWNSASATISSVTDTKNNSYTFLFQSRGYIANNNIACYYCPSIVVALANVNTVTVALSTSCTFSVNVSVEVSGFTAIDPNAPAGQFQSGSGGAAQGFISTGNIQELILSFMSIVGGVYTGPGNGFTNYVLTATTKASLDYIKTTAGLYVENPTESAMNGYGAFMVALIGTPNPASPFGPATNEVLINGPQVLSGNGNTMGNPASNILDANDLTYWQSTLATGDWVGQDAGVAVQLTRVRFSPRGGNEDHTLGGVIQGSNDPTFVTGNETMLIIFPRPVQGALMNEYAVSAQATHRYFRFWDQSPLQGAGNVGDVDFIAQFANGVSGACATPVISPKGRQFDLPVVITLSCITTTASIYYTLDGTTPTPSSTLYTGPFVLSGQRTQLQAIAAVAGLSNSRVVSAIFYIPSSFQSVDIIYDNRNWPMTGEGCTVQDPVSGWWYRLSANYDAVGCFFNGALGNLMHKSADLRNWIYVNTIITPPAGQAVNYNFYSSRPVLLYNALNNNYVIWSHTFGAAGNLTVYTASNVEGPYTLFATYSTLDGLSGDTSSDLTIMIDTDGVTAWLYRGPCSSIKFIISKLTTDYKNTVNGSVVTYPDDNTSPFGQESEGWTAFFNQGYYFVVASGFTTWQPNTNYYVTSSKPTGPQGPWTARVNPFQPAVIPQTPGNIFEGVVPGPSNAYDSQAGSIIQIPGRNAFIATFDRWDNGLVNPTATSATAPQFLNYRKIILPISFPSQGAMAINWSPAWNLDNVFPTISGAPLGATNLTVSGGVATWTNNEPKPANIYLDCATDFGFSNPLWSEALPLSATSFTTRLTILNRFLRIRTVNANGSSNSAFVYVPAAPPPTVTVGSTGLYVALNVWGAYQVWNLVAGVNYASEIQSVISGPYTNYNAAILAQVQASL